MVRTRKSKTETGTRKPRSPTDPPAGSIESSATPDELDFWVRIKAITLAEWAEGMKVYLYLIWPIIDRKEGEHYIAKLSEGFDEDFLLRTYGSGKYYLRLNDRSGHTVASKTVSVYNAKMPPKVNAEEVVVGDPRNERYFAAWPKKSVDRDRSSDPDAQGNSSAVLAAVKEFSSITKSLLDRGAGLQEDQRQMLKTAHDESLKLVVDQAKSEPFNPQSFLTTLTEAQKLFAPPPVAAVPDSLEMLEKILKITKELRPAPAPAAPEEKESPIDQLLALLDLSEKLEGRFGKGAGDSGGNTARIIMEALPGVLKEAKGITADLAVLVAARARGVPAPAPVPANPAPGAAPAVAAPSGPEPAPPAPGPVAVPNPREILNQNLRRTISNMLLKGDPGEEAALVAEKTDPTWTAEFVTVLRTDPAALAGDPIFAPVLSSPRLPDFVAGFLAYFSPEPEGDEASGKKAGAADE